ncbi:MAG: hypothetical protein ICV85_16585 [Tolypothrix sp. T3-bin4]|nr:hypothetical protein [Tolypothrix sp. T3-bin4]
MSILAPANNIIKSLLVFELESLLFKTYYRLAANQLINLIIKKISPREKKLKGDRLEVATAIHEAVKNTILDMRTNPALTVEFKSSIALIKSPLSSGIKTLFNCQKSTLQRIEPLNRKY